MGALGGQYGAGRHLDNSEFTGLPLDNSELRTGLPYLATLSEARRHARCAAAPRSEFRACERDPPPSPSHLQCLLAYTCGITEPTVRCVVYIHSFPTTSRTQEASWQLEIAAHPARAVRFEFREEPFSHLVPCRRARHRRFDHAEIILLEARESLTVRTSEVDAIGCGHRALRHRTTDKDLFEALGSASGFARSHLSRRTVLSGRQADDIRFAQRAARHFDNEFSAAFFPRASRSSSRFQARSLGLSPMHAPRQGIEDEGKGGSGRGRRRGRMWSVGSQGQGGPRRG